MKFGGILFFSIFITQTALAGALCLRATKHEIPRSFGPPLTLYLSEVLISDHGQILKTLKNHKETEATIIDERMICQHFDLQRINEIEQTAQRYPQSSSTDSVGHFTSYLYGRFTADAVPNPYRSPTLQYKAIQAAESQGLTRISDIQISTSMVPGAHLIKGFK